MTWRLAVAGVTIALTTLGALADARAEAPSVGEDSAANPWYDRFTYSAGVRDGSAGWSASEAEAALAWRPSARWGVTVNIRQAEPAVTPAQAGTTDQTALGAFYHFTPRLRVGGEVSVAGQRVEEAPFSRAARPADASPAAGVKLESAFRF